MAFDVQEYRAFIELLYKHPEWRAELRQLVLTEELLTLPQLVQELVEAHKRGEERMTRIEQSLVELVEAQKRNEQSIAELVEAQKRNDERFAELIEVQKRHEERLAGVEERLTRLEQTVAELVEAQKRNDERFAELIEVQKRHEERLAGVEERLTRLEQTVAELVEAQKRNDERFAELIEVQKRHEERLAAVEERLAKVEERLEGVEERLTRLENTVAELAEAQKRTELEVQRLTNRMGHIVGDLLEIKYRDKPFSYFGRIVRRARVVDLAEVEDWLGERLSEEQLIDLFQLDLVVRGQLRQPRGERKEHPEVWLAVEVSSVVDGEDVQRAARRAEILRQAGLPVLAVAAGGNLTPEARELARTKGVALQADGQLELLEEALANLGE
jgi:hypothetical protein